MLNTPSRQRGFNIVELMVAITLGLIVSIAVISFLASTIESTNAAMRATRLNQELRSLAEVIARCHRTNGDERTIRLLDELKLEFAKA